MDLADSRHERARRARRVGFLIAAAFVVAGAWIVVPDPPGPAPLDDLRVAAVSAADTPVAELIAGEAAASPRVAAEVHAPIDGIALSPESPAKAAKRVSSGKLRVRAVDVATREPLDPLRVRAASADRMADREGVAEVALTLTPDTYTPLVLVPGYEPAQLAAVRLDSGAEIELTAELRRGCASIAGVVIGSGVASHAELAGTGRRPCDRCGDNARGVRSSVPGAGWNRLDPCAHCGFASRFTRIPVGLAADFAFTNLASGTYALRLTDDRGHGEGTPLLVELHDAQRLQVEMRAPVLRDVLLDFIDVDLVSLAGAWGANVRADGDAAGFVATEWIFEDLVWRFAVLEGAEFFGRGEFSTPARAGTGMGMGRALSGRKRGTSARDDRERRADEELRPPAEVPAFPEVVLESSVREDGLVRIEGVPAHELTIRLTCEPFLATVTVPESTASATVRAQLERIADGTNVPATFRALDAARYR